MKIIDISTFNTVNDFAKVHLNCDGVIIRLGYRGYGSGGLVKDRQCDNYVKQCIANKIPFGFYFVTQAVNTSESIQESQFCINYVKSIDKTYFKFPIFIDNENCNGGNGRGDKINKTVRTDIINTFCATIEKSGYKSGLYCSDSWLDDKLIYSKLSVPYYWIARYSDNEPKHKYNLWQYTSKGIISGISGNVDISKGNISQIEYYEIPTLNKILQLIGCDSSFDHRKKIAVKNGIVGTAEEYTGSYEQNEKMLNLAYAGKLIKA